MPEPYYPGQKPGPCGCYYPDVTRICDNMEEKLRTHYCATHGECHSKTQHPHRGVESIPTDEWRREERNRLRTQARPIAEAGASSETSG